MFIGYARISKTDGSQVLDLQYDALSCAGVSVDHIYEDVTSGNGHRANRNWNSCTPPPDGRRAVLWRIDLQRPRRNHQTTTRIEDTAKFLLGITAGTSGLYLSAYKLAMGKATVTGLLWSLPFLFWAAAIVLLILVIFPQKYETFKKIIRRIQFKSKTDLVGWAALAEDPTTGSAVMSSSR